MFLLIRNNNGQDALQTFYLRFTLYFDRPHSSLLLCIKASSTGIHFDYCDVTELVEMSKPNILTGIMSNQGQSNIYVYWFNPMIVILSLQSLDMGKPTIWTNVFVKSRSNSKFQNRYWIYDYCFENPNINDTFVILK